MAVGVPKVEATVPGDGASLADGSTAEVLRLLSAGAAGAIVMALGEGPLRTKSLTEAVPGYAPRTVYRYASKLAELEVVARTEGKGVPSSVTHTLTAGCGAELYELIDRFAGVSLARLPDGRIESQAWASLSLLADLWEAGMVEDLACGGKSPTELARGPHGLSYHQVNRRAGLFKTGGLLCEWQGPGRRRCYGLTEMTRLKMSLLAGVARWRHLHVIAADGAGMSSAEMATVLRVALPLVELPEHGGQCLRFSVLAATDLPGAEGEEVWAEVDGAGEVHSRAEAPAAASGWGRGKVEDWISVILDGGAGRVLVGGEGVLADDALRRLHEAFWPEIPV
jgi:DNA-binding HxlR family transcriptional regulator